jgi:hypothetical protein
MACAEAWKWSVAVVSVGNPNAIQQRISEHRRRPVDRPDRRLVNCSRLRHVAQKPAVRSTPFARQVAASLSPLLPIGFLSIGAVLPPQTVSPQRLSRDTSPPGVTTSLGRSNAPIELFTVTHCRPVVGSIRAVRYSGGHDPPLVGLMASPDASAGGLTREVGHLRPADGQRRVGAF